MSNVWKISPGQNAAVWPECLEMKCISINWFRDFDLFEFKTKADLLAELIRTGEGKSGSASTIWSFVHEVNIGDIVVANNGLSVVEGIGIVRGKYLPPNHRLNPNREQTCHQHVRKVDWIIQTQCGLGNDVFNQPTLHRLSLDHITRIKKCYLKFHQELKQAICELFPVRLESTDAGLDQGDFVPDDEDNRQTVQRQIKARRGQKKFRDSQVVRFAGACAMSGCQLTDLLEAAHISPYRGDKDNDPSNGLLLRADLHTLFDLDLIAIQPATKKLVLSKKLKDDPYYSRFQNERLRCGAGVVISKTALKIKYEAFLDAEAES